MHKNICFAVFALIVTFFASLQMQGTQYGAFLLAKKETITVCHVASGNTMEIPIQTLDTHLNHGDYLGPCQSSSSSSSSESSSSENSSDSSNSSSGSSLSSVSSSFESSFSSAEDKFVIVCHVESGQTLELPEKAAEAHLAHGDYIGGCITSSSSHSISSQSFASTTNATVSSPEVVRLGAGSGKGNQTMAINRGHGLREHAAALDLTLQRHGLHQNTTHTYAFDHESIKPAAFSNSNERSDWLLKTHAVSCSMYRYLQRIHEVRPGSKIGYVDWLSERLGEILGQDAEEIKAVLLGFPSSQTDIGIVRSINEVSCQSNPYVSGSLWLEHVSSTNAKESTEIALDEQNSHSLSTLTIRESLQEDGIQFRIMNNEEAFTNFAESQQSQIHSILIRDDLSHYSHVHPIRNDEGMWHLDFTPPAGGTYWMFADFLDSDGKSHIIRHQITFPGTKGPYGFQKDSMKIQRAGKFFVELKEKAYSDGTIFHLYIHDRLGYQPELDFGEHGYQGHGTLLSAEGEYVHLHPSPAGDSIVVRIPKLEPGYYRFFFEFQIQGKKYSTKFDWEQE